MKRIWRYIFDGELPSYECDCLCRVRSIGTGFIFITLHYFKEQNEWCSVETGALVDTNRIESWAELNDVLERCC